MPPSAPLRHRQKPSLRRAFSAVSVLAVLAAAGLTALTPAAQAATAPTDPTPAQAWRIVQQYSGVWTSPPTQLTNNETPDAPLLGNGDVGAAIGGSIDDQTFYLGKNDFFANDTHAVKALGRLVLAVPGMAGASYHMTEDIAHAQAVGTYTLNNNTVTATSWVSATKDVVVTTLSLAGGGTAQPATLTVQNGAGGTPTTTATGGGLDADVSADSAGPNARLATRLIGGTAATSGNTLSLTLQPGSSYTLVTGVQSSVDTSSYQSAADGLVNGMAAADVSTLNTAHRTWWQNFWQQSYVEIPNKAVEKSWYGSLYLLASASRTGEAAPGLWGPWATSNSMNWNGDYHTNYNYEAPFYAALSTNHIPQMDSYDQPVLDYLPAAEAAATAAGFTGAYYPVGISPKGTTAGISYHNQKSDAANLASDMVMRYEYTHDAAYAAKVYPFLKQVGTFWQNYLTKDSSGTYHIQNDAPQEDDAAPQTDSTLSLGLVHLLFQGLLDMSSALGQDSGTRATWQDIESHLAPLPTTTVNGETVFSETTDGAGFVNDGNDIDIQAVYPGSLVGLDSDATLQQTARNTVDQLTSAWHGGNAPATFYAAAARVGYNPSTLMANLQAEATSDSYDNLAVHHSGGGLENVNVVTSGLDEMLLQSFQNDVKVFADWPTNTNGRFGDLLAYGDFLVSSSISGNTVQYLQAKSQAGGNFVFTNPWPGQSVEVYRNGTDTGTVSGSRITLATTSGDVLDLAPAGTSLATIGTELGQPLQSSTTTSFSSGFESTDPQPTWLDTVDTSGGGDNGVTGICCSLTGPQASPRSETAHTGSSALMYSGLASGTSPHAYLEVYDLSGSPLTVGASTQLSYWIYPQSNAKSTWVPAGSDESSCVAVDLVFTDNSTLRDSGAVDQNGNRAHPSHQCGHLTLDTWNHVTVNLGTNNNGKQISRILVGYDHPGGSGGYRGYVDDIAIG